MYTAVRIRLARCRSAAASDAGFTIVETVVAMVVFMIVMGGGITLIISGQNAAQAARVRVVETNVLRGEVNRALQLATPSAANYTITTGGRTFAVTRSVGLVPTTTASASPTGTACPTGGLRRIDVSVSWAGRSIGMTTAQPC